MKFNKKWLLAIPALLVILIIVHFIRINFDFGKSKDNFYGADLKEEDSSALASCGLQTEMFNVSPIAPADYFAVTPLGNVSPTGFSHIAPADHLYINLTTEDPNDKKSLPIEASVYSPGNITLLRVDKVEVYQPIAYTDYTLFFSPCKEVVAEYHHVSTLTQKLLDQLNDPFWCDKNSQQKYCIYKLNIPLSAGEIIGTAGGNKVKNRAMDLQAYDFRSKELEYVNKSRYSHSQLHMVCPFDYFTEEIQNQFYSKIGKTSDDAPCGEIMYDIPGTIQGNWVQKGKSSSENEDYILSLIQTNFDIKRPVFSFGAKAFPKKEQSWLTFDIQESGNINIDFPDTKDGEVYCYQNLRVVDGQAPVDYSLLIQSNADKTMKLKIIDAKECNNFDISSDFIEFER